MSEQPQRQPRPMVVAVRYEALKALYDFWLVWWEEVSTYDDGRTGKYSYMTHEDMGKLSDAGEMVDVFDKHIREVLDGR